MQPRKQCTNEEQNTTKVKRLSGPRRRPHSTPNRHQSTLESDDLLAQAAKKAMHQRRAKHPWSPAIVWAPPATTEHTKPPPITPRIRRFASTGSQESNAPTNSKTPQGTAMFWAPPATMEHAKPPPVAAKSQLVSCHVLTQAAKKAMYQ